MKLQKKPICLFLAFCITAGCLLFPVSAANGPCQPDFDPISQGVYLVNTDTNTVVYEKNANQQIVPASLVKMMTAIVALESSPKENREAFLNTQVTAPPYVFDELYGLNASTADIRPNETLTMNDLLHAMLISSACEAASIIADYVSKGNIQEFVDKMNKKAKEIGANDTVFVDPHGLDEDKQRSTAHDMFLITQYGMRDQTFSEIVTTPSYTMAATNKHSQPRIISHTNHMLSKYMGGSYYDSRVKGIKTGTATGIKNLITEAEENSYHYILVLMGASTAKSTSSTYQDTESIYNWAFKNLSFKTLGLPYEKMIPNTIKVHLGNDADSVVLTPKDQVIELLPNTVDPSSVMWDTSRLPSELNAPLKKGTYVGEVDLKLAAQTIQTIPVVVAQDVHASIPALILHDISFVITSWWFIVIVVLLILLSAAYLILTIRHNKKKKRARAKDRYLRLRR